MKKNIMIIGLGLIGGSLGLALKGSNLINKIIGFDIDDAAINQALEIGCIDDAVNLLSGIHQADIIFLCTPLSSYAAILGQIKSEIKPGTIVSDVGSTKEEIMKLFQGLPEGVWGIGGHPMAGAESQGIKGADRYLFENAVYILTPDKNTPADVLEILIKLLKATGAKISIMEASRHDQLAAIISHIPHLAAVALVNQTADHQESLLMAGGGFRDTTRIASSNPVIWHDILYFNRKPIIKELDKLITYLHKLRKALVNFDAACIDQELTRAQKTRDTIPRVQRGLIPVYYDIVCIVPDKPGIIGQLGLILGQQDINIVDIEIIRVREGDGGTIRLGVPSLQAAHAAVAILKEHDIKAWLR
jgi:prephenate dehydrogenase